MGIGDFKDVAGGKERRDQLFTYFPGFYFELSVYSSVVMVLRQNQVGCGFMFIITAGDLQLCTDELLGLVSDVCNYFKCLIH